MGVMQSGDERGRAFPRVHESTALLREILTISDEYEVVVAKELEVNHTDLVAMQHLISSGHLTPSDIARRLGITTAAVTVVVDRLVKAGHVRREPNPNDRRGVLVVPDEDSTAKARGLLAPMIMDIDSVAQDFDEAEREVIVRYLEGVVASYREHLGPSAS